jgi:hypothetical protein
MSPHGRPCRESDCHEGYFRRGRDRKVRSFTRLWRRPIPKRSASCALIGLAADRNLGTHILDPATGGVLLWQNLFWFFGHPEVYIIALPFFGVVSEVFSVFSRKPIFGYTGLIYVTRGIAALSVTVWAHHMYATGARKSGRNRCTTTKKVRHPQPRRDRRDGALPDRGHWNAGDPTARPRNMLRHRGSRSDVERDR